MNDGNMTIVTSTISDIIPLFRSIYNTKISQRLTDLGFTSVSKDMRSIEYELSHFLFCPNRKITTVIETLTNQMKQKQIVGFQIRTGGKTANTKEDITFFNIKRLPELDRLVNQYINQYSVYISTDSYYILNHLKNITNNRVFYMTQFMRGHSSAVRNGKNLQSSFEGAVCDLGVLSKSTILHFTNRSSYGRFARSLSKAKTVVIL